jgi:hypothetical protein
MERNEVSRHEVEVIRVLTSHQGQWLTNQQIRDAATDVAPRTVRATTLKLVRLGLLDQAEVFPAHRYRLSGFAAKRNRGYWDRVQQAAEVFGVKLGNSA